MQELKELSKNKVDDVKLEANDSDIHRWKAHLTVSVNYHRWPGDIVPASS